jgi:transcriptional regulator with XRE-family HTH domain
VPASRLVDPNGPGDVGRRIRHLRVQRGLSEEELAARSRTSTGYLQYVEQRAAEVAPGTLTRIAAALSTTVADLLGAQPQAADAADGAVAESLAADECWSLLRRGRVGRLAFVTAGEVTLRPVNYEIVRETVVLLTRDGSRLSLAGGSRAVMETDEALPGQGRARLVWSVLVTGVLRRPDADEVAALHRLPLLQPWEPGAHDVTVQLVPEQLSGRRFVVPATSVSVGAP